MRLSMAFKFYQYKPLPIGIEVFGLNLMEPLEQKLIQQIKKDVTKHRIVVFRNQGKISGEKQVEISKWFGEIDNTTFTKHPSSPSVDIFCVSNDPEKGCTGVGMSGWHIDGTFRQCPYAYSIYHMYEVPKQGGDTMFIPLTEVISKLPPETRRKWERLYMVSDRRGHFVHPLIYKHPTTGKPTLCVHLGMTTSFAYDFDKSCDPNEVQLTTDEETEAILKEIQAAIADHVPVYSHKWMEEGDFIISDNLAVGHQAGPISSSLAEAGLRVLHRVTVKGTTPPCKDYDFIPPDCDNCAY